MATPAWEKSNQAHLPSNLDTELQSIFDTLHRAKEAWKCQQRLALFDCCEPEKMERKISESQQTANLRQLQSQYATAETQLVQWRQTAATFGDTVAYAKCQHYLQNIIQNSFICLKQPPPIVDSESKRSRPKVEVLLLCGKISNVVQDGQEEITVHLLTEDQGRSAGDGKGLPVALEYSVQWIGKKPVPMTWDSANRWFRARFNDLELKKPSGGKWLDGYHLYFCNGGTGRNVAAGGIQLWTLSTPFEIVSNRTGQLNVKTRNEFWRLSFCTSDSNSATVGLLPAVPAEQFWKFFARWFQGYTGVLTGLNEEHNRSIINMLKAQDGVVTLDRLKRNWEYLYKAAGYVKQNTFLWNAGILNYCFATREEAEKILAQFHENMILIKFQNSAPGCLSISFIMPAESPDQGRYFAHYPFDLFFKRCYTFVQCMENADLKSPKRKLIKLKLRDFKILGTAEDFDYRQLIQDDQRNQEQIYESMQSRHSDAGEDGANGSGPCLSYCTVKERFQIPMQKFPEEHFNRTAVNSPAGSLHATSIDSPPSSIGATSPPVPSSLLAPKKLMHVGNNSRHNQSWLSPQSVTVPSASPNVVQSSPTYDPDQHNISAQNATYINSAQLQQAYGAHNGHSASNGYTPQFSTNGIAQAPFMDAHENMSMEGMEQVRMVPQQFSHNGASSNYNNQDSRYIAQNGTDQNIHLSANANYMNTGAHQPNGYPPQDQQLQQAPIYQNVYDECITEEDLTMLEQAFSVTNSASSTDQWSSPQHGKHIGLNPINPVSAHQLQHQHPVVSSVDDQNAMDMEITQFYIPNQ